MSEFIKYYEDLYVSKDGRCLNKKTGRIIGHKNNKGYNIVSYKGKSFKIYRMVAETFLPNPNNYPCVDHIIPVKNGGTDDVSNLRWVTYSENSNNPLSLINYSKGHKGFHFSDESRLKMSKAKKGKQLSDETKKKMSESLKGRTVWNKGKAYPSKRKKKVSQYSKDGELIKIWDSITEAINVTGFKSIANALRYPDKYKTAGGFIWKYL